MLSPAAGKLLTFEEARHVVEEHASKLRPNGKELVELVDSTGLLLAEPILADRNFPPFPRSTRDGFAIRTGDLSKLPTKLQVTAEIKAGSDLKIKVEPGQAAAIMTGAAVPQGSDAVVMVEYTARQGDWVEVTKGVSSGENIVPSGSEAKRGERLLAPGTRLDHAAVAAAASVGKSHLLVYLKPKVAVLATGDEIVDLDVMPASHQMRNSNTYSLAAQIQAAGGEPVLLPIAPDEPERLRELMADGFEADLLLLSGGVSMGKYDLVEQVLAEFDAEFFFTGAQIQPGKPIVFGRALHGRDWKYFFGLPGNPISTMVTFELFARVMLEAVAGLTPHKLVFLHARLKSEIKTKTGLKRFLPAILSGELEHTEVELAKWQGSGDLAAVSRANCYIVIPPDREKIAAGEWVPVMLR